MISSWKRKRRNKQIKNQSKKQNQDNKSQNNKKLLFERMTL
jgi:hypothetical protein